MQQVPPRLEKQDVDRLSGLGLSATIENGLRAVIASNPASHYDAVKKLTEYLSAGLSTSASSVQREFKQQILEIESGGFGSDTCTLVFGVPDAEGRLTELFPGGRRVSVRSCNYSQFRALFALFMENGSAINDAYREQARLHFPVCAEENLMCGDYEAILDLVENHLMREGSPWSILDNAAASLRGRLEETIWDVYRVTEHVPFRGRLFSVRNDFYPPGAVRSADWAKFVTDARACLLQLRPLKQLQLSYADPLAPAATRFLFGESTTEDLLAQLNRSVLSIAVNPYLTEGCTDTFSIPIANGSFDLVDNAERVALCPRNVRVFVENFVRRRVEIALAINSVTSPASPENVEADSDVSAMRMRICPPELSAQWNVVRVDARDRRAFDTVVPAAVAMSHNSNCLTESLLAQFGLVFAVPLAVGFYRLIPGGESIPVTMSTLDEFITRVQYARNALSPSVESAQPSQVVKPHPPAPVSNFANNLISAVNGTRMTEMQEATGATRERPFGAPASVWNRFSSTDPVAPRPSPPRQPYGGFAPAEDGGRARSAPTTTLSSSVPLSRTLLPSSASRLSTATTTQSPPEQYSPHASVARAENSSTTSYGINERDLPALDNLEYHLQRLGEVMPGITETEWQQMGCTWVLRIPGINVVIPLFDGGARRAVEYAEAGRYVEEACAALDRVRQAVKETGSYPPPGVSQTVMDPIQQSILAMKNAVPQTPTAQDRALFSPTHTANDLFAPIERMN